MKWHVSDDLKLLFKLSTPVMLSMLLQSLFSMVDLFFVAKLGTLETAAVALGGSAFGTMISLTVLITSATSAIVARAKGAADEKSLLQYGALTTLLSAILGILMGVALVLNQERVIRILYDPDPSTLAAVTQYLSLMFWGFAVFFIAGNGRAILQAQGDTMTPLWVFGISNLVNVVLDPIFIFVLNMGISGAALATVIANFVALVWLYIIIIKRNYQGSLSLFLNMMTLKVGMILSILRIGFWDALQSIARPITGMLMFSMVYKIGGNTATAAFGIGGQLFNYTFVILTGLSVSIGILTGQSLGEGNIAHLKKLVRNAFWVASINMALFALPYLLWSRPLFQFFRNDPGIIAHGMNYLTWVYPGVCFVVFTTIYGGLFRGAGATREPMVASLVANVVLKLPLAYVLSNYTTMGIDGIWLAISLSVVAEAAIVVFYYKMGNWQRVKAYISA